jgi:hypothetical protein
LSAAIIRAELRFHGITSYVAKPQHRQHDAGTEGSDARAATVTAPSREGARHRDPDGPTSDARWRAVHRPPSVELIGSGQRRFWHYEYLQNQ